MDVRPTLSSNHRSFQGHLAPINDDGHRRHRCRRPDPRSLRKRWRGTGGGSGGSDGGAGGGTGEPIYANTTEPENPLIPTNTGEVGGGRIIVMLFAGLVYYTADGSAENDLAESIETEDNQNWTIKIREGLTYSDGSTPVTAQDFVNAWNYGANAANAQLGQYFFEPIEGYAIVVATRLGEMNTWTVIGVLSVFGWTNVARIMRGAVISTKSQDYVTSSVALGASSSTVLLKHVIPNAIAPVIVTATVNLGVFIVAEATLSFLGVGLPTSSVSWGGDISAARDALRTQPSMLFYPSLALAITVLSFIMLGDAVRDALDPKARKR